MLIFGPVVPVDQEFDPAFFERPGDESGDPLKEDDSVFGHVVFKIC